MALQKVRDAIQQFEYSTELDDMAFDSPSGQDKAVRKAIKTLHDKICTILESKSMTMTSHTPNIVPEFIQKRNRPTRRRRNKRRTRSWFF